MVERDSCVNYDISNTSMEHFMSLHERTHIVASPMSRLPLASIYKWSSLSPSLCFVKTWIRRGQVSHQRVAILVGAILGLIQCWRQLICCRSWMYLRYNHQGSLQLLEKSIAWKWILMVFVFYAGSVGTGITRIDPPTAVTPQRPGTRPILVS